MIRLRHLFILFLAMPSGIVSLFAADVPFFSTLTTRDGLPSNIMSAIAQDQNDFMWIGTANGLCRYDGHQFIVFKKESTPELPANEISSLLVDGDDLWVGTWKGLCKINTLTFRITNVDLGENNIIRTLYKTTDGIVWVGTSTGLIRLETDGYRAYNTSNSHLSHNTIRAIQEDSFGNLWIGTYDKVNKLPSGTEDFIPFDVKRSYKPSLENNLICDIKPAHADSLLWIGTETGLVLFNVKRNTYVHITEKVGGFSNEVIKNIYRDDQGTLWLGTDFGLNIFNPHTLENKAIFHNPQLSYSIANNVIWDIHEDKGGIVWFVTSNGLSRLNKFRDHYRFHPVSHFIGEQTVGNQVKSVLVTEDGVHWLGTLHGVIRIDPRTGDEQAFSTQSPDGRRILLNNVYALEEDIYGRIWIGTAGGINIWDPKTHRMHAITSNQTNGLLTNYIARFVKAPDGTMWVSAWEAGLFKVTGDLSDVRSLRFELVGDFGSEKNVAGSNAIWAVNYNELLRIDLNSHRITHIDAFNRISERKTITCLYFSRRGSLWSGTMNGLIEYRPQTDSAIFHPLVTGNDVTLASITEDSDGNIWTAAGGFLIRYHPTKQISEIFPLDKDIPLKTFFDGCHAVGPDGRIIFGGDNGFIAIDPRARTNLYKPNVYITAIEINNRQIRAGEPVDDKILLTRDIAFTPSVNLNYTQRSLAVEFSALHYWQPEMNIFAYKLEGFDDKWTYVSGARNFAIYSNLGAGSYTLKVRGTNNYGIWSDTVATLAVVVNPPLLLSRPFIALYVLIAAALIYVGLRFYSARIHLKNEVEIATMEKEHTEELARTKQQFFTNISHELRTPISLILPPIQQVLKREYLDSETRSLIRLAEKNSHRLLRVVNQILDFRKLEHDSLELHITHLDIIPFCKELYSLFSDKAARNEIHFTFNPSVATCKVWADTEKVETILYNLLSNAFKFTLPHGSIDVAVSVYPRNKEHREGTVEIRISDTGIGIGEEHQTKIFERFYQTEEARKMEGGSGIGLTLAAEYARLHNGMIKVRSAPGKGSCFTVALPLGNVHFPLHTAADTEPLNLVATKTDARDDASYLYDIHSDKPLLLIAEDNPEMVDFLVLSLKRDYHLIVAANGEDALRKASSFYPEVVITDIMMPVMDGLTLCRKIKENHQTSHIGIILLTAKSLTSQKIEGIRTGADVYLTKPFEMELLEASIDHLLKRKQELSSYFRSEIITEPREGHTRGNEDERFIKKVMNIIEANISNPDFSVEMISDEIGMSSTHLYRKLKSLTLYSGKDIIRKYRIKKASLLLKNKEGNISQIMYDVGFSSHSYFAKCFKAEFGVSPKEYQQREGKGIEFKV